MTKGVMTATIIPGKDPRLVRASVTRELAMKKISAVIAAVVTIGGATIAHAWNFGAKHLSVVSLHSDGKVRFALFEEGQSGAEVQCQENSVWFTLQSCRANDAQCIAATSRMTSLLLTAEATRTPIYVQRDGCTVTEVAKRP